jgi:hypothetical protein
VVKAFRYAFRPSFQSHIKQAADNDIISCGRRRVQETFGQTLIASRISGDFL